MRALFGIVVLILMCTNAALAFGHPHIDEARRRFEAADFDGALQALEAAEAANDLSRPDIVELVELRSIVHNALGDEDSCLESLGALASLDSGHQFPPEAPPELVELFSGINVQPLALRVSRQQDRAGAILEASVLHDTSGLVQRITLRARPVGEGEWQRSVDEPLLVELSRDDREEWHAEAIGPGNAVLVTASSVGEDRSPTTDGRETEADDPEPFTSRDNLDRYTHRERRRWTLWVGVGAGVAAVMIIAIVVGVVVGTGQSEGNTEISGPFVQDF